ncbi:MAG: hypothetical protein IJS14_05755 [Lentisphaeria bacterium]|nr:hypothetical protein [Lentisphaeria bacterium]
MEISEHPNRYIWTFGNHEPLSMYRRIGRKSTGGVPGGALWLEKWHHWYDSEECAETMASLHLNLLHCRCYKGLGWETEKKDFPNVVSFARNCRKHGIKVLAYIQHASVYPEIMRREIPNLADWCSVDRDGKLWNYLDSYWRWIPCPNRPGYLEYMDKVIARIVGSGEFDGVMFDNLINYPCYCPDCRRLFAQQLEEAGYDFLDPRFVEMPPEKMPEEIMDPVAVEYLRFRHNMIARTMKHYRDVIKAIDPDCIISGNVPVMPRRESYTFFNTPPAKIVPWLDVPLSQTGNQPGWDGKDCVISQQHEIKLSHALHSVAVPLNDSDAGGESLVGGAYIGPLFESLFGNTVPVDRIIMKPRRGGGLNEERIAARKPVLNRLYELSRQWEDLFALPDHEPVGLLYSEDSLTLSKKAADAYLRCSESLLRNHIPYRVVASCGDELDEASMAQCTSFILPNANCLSDAVVRKIRNYRGKLYLAGDENGSNDEKYRERETLPFEDLAAVKLDIPQHDVSKANWKLTVHFVPDDWKQIFDPEIAFELHPAAHPVIKMRDGKVAAILISAPTAVPASRVKVPPAMQEAGYQAVTLDGTSTVSFLGDTAELPAFEGMLMVISTREKAKAI